MKYHVFLKVDGAETLAAMANPTLWPPGEAPDFMLRKATFASVSTEFDADIASKVDSYPIYVGCLENINVLEHFIEFDLPNGTSGTLEDIVVDGFMRDPLEVAAGT